MTLGLKDLYYAVCTESEGAETYGEPKKWQRQWKLIYP